MRAALFPRTWTRCGLSFRVSQDRNIVHANRFPFRRCLSCQLLYFPLPAVSPRTTASGSLVMTRPTDDGVALPRCLWHCADDDTREYPPRGSSFSLSLSLFLSFSPSPLASLSLAFFSSPPTRGVLLWRTSVEAEADGRRERETWYVVVHTRATRSPSWDEQAWTPEQANYERGSAGNLLLLCPGLVASRLPRLPSSTWNSSAWRRVGSFAEYNASYIGCPSLKHRLPPSSTIPFKPTRLAVSFSLSLFLSLSLSLSLSLARALAFTRTRSALLAR